jgi:RIO kinase 2
MVNLEAAKKEYGALRRLHPLGIPVPEATARERHTVLMKKLCGSRLSNIKTLDHPAKMLRNIIESARLTYTLGGIVNCDLSVHNIICNGEKIWMTSWSQYVGKDHPNSSKLLDRDLLNIFGFFRERFMIDCKLEATTFYVRGWSDRLEIF